MRSLLCALWLVASGCASFSTLQRADVLPAGKTRLGIVPLTVARQGDADPQPTASLVLTARRGLGHDFEVGGRVWAVGIGAGVKYQLLDTKDLVLSIAPELLASLQGRSSALTYDVALPVLAGLDVGAHQLVVGLRVVTRWWQITRTRNGPTDEWTNTTFPGGVVGFDFALPGGLHLMPEFNLSRWPAGEQWFWTAAVGLYFDLG